MARNTTDKIELADLKNIDDLVASHPELFTANRLRHLLRNRKTSGLSHAVVRVGKRLYVSEKRLSEWLSAQAEKAAA